MLRPVEEFSNFSIQTGHVGISVNDFIKLVSENITFYR